MSLMCLFLLLDPVKRLKSWESIASIVDAILLEFLDDFIG